MGFAFTGRLASTPSAFYAVSVRRLALLALRLPSHIASQLCNCLRLVVIMLTMSPCRYSHRGLAPHKFAPMLGAPKRSSGRQQSPWLRHFHGLCWYPPLAALLPAPLTLGVRLLIYNHWSTRCFNFALIANAATRIYRRNRQKLESVHLNALFASLAQKDHCKAAAPTAAVNLSRAPGGRHQNFSNFPPHLNASSNQKIATRLRDACVPGFSHQPNSTVNGTPILPIASAQPNGRPLPFALGFSFLKSVSTQKFWTFAL